jgi:hypothetical protein
MFFRGVSFLKDNEKEVKTWFIDHQQTVSSIGRKREREREREKEKRSFSIVGSLEDRRNEIG